ncbi:MAG TPA: HD domain-containing phosphohydrolase [Bryobacteraceae bacterium]|nr:HD domain-containing phosphohydrolase [Bryobacteraceae bacterium]
MPKLYLWAHIAIGSAALLGGLAKWECHDPVRFAAFLITAALASALKVRMPGVTGTMSVSALFVLVGIVNLSLSETLVVGAVSLLVQTVWRVKARPRFVQVAFNVANTGTAILLSTLVLQYTHSQFGELAGLAFLAVTYFAANTVPVACIIGLTEAKSILAVWRGYRGMLPFYIVGCSMAWLVGTVPHGVQWEIPIICLPLVYLVHRSHRSHIEHIEQMNKHVLEVNDLHLRTIEALACAIDAKDHTTHDHLQRVQLYAVEIGKELKLSETELEALRAAATLHDIGKLAVPESIISKPGKLTRAEFEKMKVHPVVGAEILERVNFPYPVVPIVRAHHERWDGNGYPFGLKGAEIPIGARILAAVDCLDALASDRQYRRALPLDEAMARVASEAGTAFDPEVVGVLQKRYRELEALAKTAVSELKAPLSVDLKIERGGAPAAGFENEAPRGLANVAPIQSATRPRNDWGNQISAGLAGREALAVAALRMEALVEYDAIGFYSCQNGFVRPCFVSGEDRHALSSLRAAQGEGLVGWVVETAQPILNGNPSVERGYPKDGRLSSALALPLMSSGGVVGVLALYRRGPDSFDAEDLAALAGVGPSVASILTSIELQSSDAGGGLLTLAQSA